MMTRFVVVGALLFAGTSHASTVTHVHHADHHASPPSHVMTGYISAKDTAWYDARLLVTTYTVTLGEVLAGQPPETLTVRLPGGEWQGWTQQAAGVPLLTIGEEVLLATDDLARVPLHGVHRVRDGQIIASDLSPLKTLPASIAELRDRVQL